MIPPPVDTSLSTALPPTEERMIKMQTGTLVRFKNSNGNYGLILAVFNSELTAIVEVVAHVVWDGSERFNVTPEWLDTLEEVTV